MIMTCVINHSVPLIVLHIQLFIFKTYCTPRKFSILIIIKRINWTCINDFICKRIKIFSILKIIYGSYSFNSL